MRSTDTQVIQARDLNPGPTGAGGDFLVGLDNGYVVSLDLVDEHTVEVLFHTAEGNEATLVCPKDMPVTIKERGVWS